MRITSSITSCRIVAESAVLAAICWRREAARYKTFTAFVAFYIIRSLVTLYCSQISLEAWGQAYFVGRAIRIPFALAVAVELFYWTARPRGLLTVGKATTFLIAFVVLAVSSCALAFADPSSNPWVAIAAYRTMDRSVDFSLFGVVLIVFIVGRTWRIYDVRERGIALGFFVWLGLDLAIEFCEYHSTAVPTSAAVRILSLSSFLIGALIWLFHFIVPQPEFARFGEPEYLEAQQWLGALLRNTPGEQS